MQERAGRRRRIVVTAAVAVGLALVLVVALRRITPSFALGTRALLQVGGIVALGYVAIAAAVAIGLEGFTRRALARFALAVAAPALLLVLLEVPSLLFDYDWRRVLARQDESFFGRMKPWKSPWNVPDAERVFRRPPATRVSGSARGDCVGWLGIAGAPAYDYDLTYDGLGFRNEATLLRATIAAVGDSFVEAAFVPTADLFTTRISSKLAVPVANLGIGGYGPQQELAVLRGDALRLKPRVVLWFFFEGNDLRDADHFERDATDSAVFELSFLTRSFMLSATSVIARSLCPPLEVDREHARRSSGTLDVAGPDQGRRIYFPYPAHPLGPEDRRGLAIVERTLAVAKEACDEAGARLVLLFVPEKFRVYGDHCTFEADALPRTWKVSDLPDRLASWASGADVDFIDLTPPLRAAAAEGGLVYFADDGHWSSRGHAVVADVIERAAPRWLSVEARR